MTWVDAAAVLAALLQTAGYILYIRHVLAGETRPNAASSLMFAYGTGLLVFLEHEAGGSWRVLLLPTVCACLGVLVAGLSLRRGIRSPVSRLEMAVFGLDVALTALYLLLFFLGRSDGETERRLVLAFWFLVASNATTLTSFGPLLMTTFLEPEREQQAPWFVWTAAYGVLLGVAVADGGLVEPVLLVYPALNLLLHAGIGALSLRGVRGSTPAPAA